MIVSFAFSIEGVGDPFPTHCKVLGAAHVFPALSRRHKGKRDFYAKGPVVEFDVILYKVFFYFEKKKNPHGF